MNGPSHPVDPWRHSRPGSALYQPVLTADPELVVGFEVFGGPVDIGRQAPRTAARQWGYTPRPFVLFRIDPMRMASGRAPLPDFWLEHVRETGDELIIEITGAHDIHALRATLGLAEWVRENGFRLGVDTTVSVAETLGLLPLVQPDIVRLHHTALRDHSPHAHPVDAVRGYCEHSGRIMLVDGIATHAERIHALREGATWMQGPLFGPPAPRRAGQPTVRRIPRRTSPRPQRFAKPSEVLDYTDSLVTSYQSVIDHLSIVVDDATNCLPGQLLVSVQHPDRFVDRFGWRFPRYADKHRLVGVLGAPSLGVPGVQAYSDRDAFEGEFSMALLTADMAVAMVAVDQGDTALAEDSFRWCVTTDRSLVGDIAASLARRLLL